MDLSTTYLGFRLPHPLMPGASPLVDSLDTVRRLEDCGAAAIVMHSLFEEQLRAEAGSTFRALDTAVNVSAEASTFFPEPIAYALGPAEYLEQIRRIRAAVAVPVIASLNGVTAEGWVEHATLMQDAGASAIELNVYYLAADPDDTSQDVEQRVADVLRAVKDVVTIPLAVKLSPFFSALANFARVLERCGADGLVLFNRFYQPDFDLDALEVSPTLRLSDSSELLLRLRWLAILSGRLRTSLAVTGGIHSGIDAIKAVMAGAHAVQLVSSLLRYGPEHLRSVRADMVRWLEEHEYDSLRQAQGSLNLLRCPDAAAFERANYMRILQSWKSSEVLP